MSNHATLHRVCKEVLASAAPPTRIRDGFSICALTGIHIEVLDPPTRIRDAFFPFCLELRDVLGCLIQPPASATPFQSVLSRGIGRDASIYQKTIAWVYRHPSTWPTQHHHRRLSKHIPQQHTEAPRQLMLREMGGHPFQAVHNNAIRPIQTKPASILITTVDSRTLSARL